MPHRYVYKKPHVRAAMRLYDLTGRLLHRKRHPKQQSEPKSICFVILHQIGDVVMTLPTIDAITTMAPKAKISIIVGHGPAELLTSNPWHATLHCFDASWQKVVRQFGRKETSHKEAKKEFRALLTKINPDVVVVFHPDLTINQILGKTKIPHTIAFANAGAGFRVTHPVWLPKVGHQVERNFALAKQFAQVFGKKLPPKHEPRIIVDRETKNSVQPIIQSAHLDLSQLAIIHPFASAATKNWSPKAWDQVCQWLTEHQFQTVMIGGPNDHLEINTHYCINLAGKLNLRQTTALISLTQLFIGIDSGPGHIAAATGTKAISIFSSAHDPKRWAPYGPRDQVMILHEPVTDRKKFPYEVRDLPKGTIGNPYSDKITPEQVIAAAKKLLKIK